MHVAVSYTHLDVYKRQGLACLTVKSFHPICGTGRSLLAGMARQTPGINPRPSVSSCSSPFSVKICIPKQIPKSGTPFATASLITATKPLRDVYKRQIVDS